MTEEKNVEENYNKTISQEEQELKMAEKFAYSNPEKLPPQFKGDPEKFMESYKELRKTLTKTQQELAATKKPKETVNAESVTPAQTEETPLPTNELAIPQAPQTPQQPTQEEWDAWGDELRKTGNIGEQSREKIRKKFGIPDGVIDQYVDGMRQKSLNAVNEAAKMVGGNDKLKAIIDWSAQNLSDAERAIINDQLSSINWKTTLLGLQARMEKSQPNPTANEPKKGNPASAKIGNLPTQAIEGFANKRDMTTHIRDPRYGRDAKYTQWVQDRIRASGASKWQG